MLVRSEKTKVELYYCFQYLPRRKFLILLLAFHNKIVRLNWFCLHSFC